MESGPNKGYGYVKSETYSIGSRQWRINERIDSGGPREVRYNNDQDTATHWDYLKNNGYDPQVVRSGVEVHEGYGQNGKKGHQGQIVKAIDTSTCKDAAALADRVVTNGKAEADKIVKEIDDFAFKAFAHSTWHNYVHGNYSGHIVLYDPGDTVPPVIHPDRDAQHPQPLYSAPNECRWEGVF